jgi:hypothetical protein
MQSTASVIMGDLSGQQCGPKDKCNGKNKGPRYIQSSNGPYEEG